MKADASRISLETLISLAEQACAIAIDIEFDLLESTELAAALERLRGHPANKADKGIKGNIALVDNLIGDELHKRIAGKSKWLDLEDITIERTSSGTWVMDDGALRTAVLAGVARHHLSDEDLDRDLIDEVLKYVEGLVSVSRNFRTTALKDLGLDPDDLGTRQMGRRDVRLHPPRI